MTRLAGKAAIVTGAAQGSGLGIAQALAAAAYNAGPRRVAEWLATYGEPGTPSAATGVDMIDWVELIPFSETRNYVQRVIENMVVYRALGGDGAQPHPLARWLAP